MSSFREPFIVIEAVFLILPGLSQLLVQQTKHHTDLEKKYFCKLCAEKWNVFVNQQYCGDLVVLVALCMCRTGSHLKEHLAESKKQVYVSVFAVMYAETHGL